MKLSSENCVKYGNTQTNHYINKSRKTMKIISPRCIYCGGRTKWNGYNSAHHHKVLCLEPGCRRGHTFKHTKIKPSQDNNKLLALILTTARVSQVKTAELLDTNRHYIRRWLIEIKKQPIAALPCVGLNAFVVTHQNYYRLEPNHLKNTFIIVIKKQDNRIDVEFVTLDSKEAERINSSVHGLHKDCLLAPYIQPRQSPLSYNDEMCDDDIAY
jgi:hypothetical protein